MRRCGGAGVAVQACSLQPPHGSCPNGTARTGRRTGRWRRRQAYRVSCTYRTPRSYALLLGEGRGIGHDEDCEKQNDGDALCILFLCAPRTVPKPAKLGSPPPRRPATGDGLTPRRETPEKKAASSRVHAMSDDDTKALMAGVMAASNYYEIFGIAHASLYDETLVRKSYRKMALKLVRAGPFDTPL